MATLRDIPPRFDNTTTLLCPFCMGRNLHHTKVEVYSRVSEDGMLTTIWTGGVGVVTGARGLSQDISKNPNTRHDDGVRICFTCETCPKTPALLVYQHKGTTFVHWETV